MRYAIVVALALIGGVLGAYLFQNRAVILGATTARTTITNPWTFSATTTMSKPLIVTTTNTATSTEQIGCIQTTATSTVTPVRFVIGSSGATTTYQGTLGNGVVAWQYGYCPNLP